MVQNDPKFYPPEITTIGNTGHILPNCFLYTYMDMDTCD